MKIVWWDVNDSAVATRAAGFLSDGEVIVNPTETIHGFAARFDNPAAIEKVIALKRRDDRKPMNLLVPSLEWLENLGWEVPRAAIVLAGKFWPGGLTIVVRRKIDLGIYFPWEGETISLRVSSHPFVIRLMKKLAVPIVSTSLNISGAEVITGDYESGLLELENIWRNEAIHPPALAVIDRELSGSLPSTVIGFDDEGEVRIFREGMVSEHEIRKALARRG
jgi:L-threonylcarbamoyladenylate synthase